MTPRAEAELMRRRSPRSPKVAQDQQKMEDCSLNVICSPRLGLVSMESCDDPVMTSTPSKNCSRLLVRSEGLEDLGAAARGGISELSSEERELREEVEEEERRMRADLKLHCPPTPVKVRTPGRLLPSSGQHTGQPQILAQQIDSEIVELRNFFEDHREEMMSLLHGEEERNTSLPLFANHRQIGERGRGVQRQLQKSRSMHFLPQPGDQEEEEDRERDSTPPPLPNPYSLPYHQQPADNWNKNHESLQLHHARQQSRILDDQELRSGKLEEWNNQGNIADLKKEECFDHESESDAVGPDRTLLLRRREFEKRRLKNRERRKKVEVANSNSSTNNNSNNNNNISSFFPVHNNIGGDQMVPRLNLESVCSDVTLATGQSLDASLASQTEDIFGLRQEEPLTRRRSEQHVSKLNCNHINSSSPSSTHGRLSSRNRSKRKSKVRKYCPIPTINQIFPGAC